MSRLIMILLVLGAFVFWWHWTSAPDAAARKRLMQRISFGVLIAVILLLVGTGHMHWVGALLAALLAFARQSLPLLIRYFPVFSQWYRSRVSAKSQQESSGRHTVTGNMSVAEALQILGLSGTPTRDEITRAYRKKMQQLHPDRGGNEYFAAKVNQARDVLNTRFG